MVQQRAHLRRLRSAARQTALEVGANRLEVVRRHGARRERAERWHQHEKRADHQRDRLPPGDEQHAEADGGRPGEQHRERAQELDPGRDGGGKRWVEACADADDRALEVAGVGREQGKRAEQQDRREPASGIDLPGGTAGELRPGSAPKASAGRCRPRVLRPIVRGAEQASQRGWHGRQLSGRPTRAPRPGSPTASGPRRPRRSSGSGAGTACSTTAGRRSIAGSRAAGSTPATMRSTATSTHGRGDQLAIIHDSPVTGTRPDADLQRAAGPRSRALPACCASRASATATG